MMFILYIMLIRCNLSCKSVVIHVFVIIIDRAIDLEEVKLLRQKVRDCQRREEVNHPQRCREHVDNYLKAYHKYRSEGII